VGIVSVKEDPNGNELESWNRRTGETAEPAAFEFMEKDEKKPKLELVGGVPEVAELITPEFKPADGVGSVFVCTVMQLAHPAVAAPIVRPLKVMAKAMPAPILAPPVVMIM
jgi:hypothetical protein